MKSHLSPGQRHHLAAELERRRRELDRTLAEHMAGQSRAEHARDLLLQDGDDAPQREPERELDQVLADRVVAEIAQASEALGRVHDPHFGLCVECGSAIPYERLKIEPWAARCVACESALEKQEARRG